MYYRCNVTGRIISDTSAKVLDDIYGEGGVVTLVNLNTITPIPDPSVIDCIKYGTPITAVMRYREIHGGSVKEVRKGVERIKRDMSRFAKKGEKKG